MKTLLEKAITFAATAHKDQFRKGTSTPYVLHPIEAATIVATMSTDPEIIAAAALHDVIEDTDTTLEQVSELFGDRVAFFVASESENKREHLSAESTWKLRKQETLNHLKSAPIEIKMITLGDKLSNMRAIHRDHKTLGDRLWARFNQKDKSEHHWYYQEIANCMPELKDYPAFQEYTELLEKVFISGTVKCTFSDVSERDMDLLLLEELVSSKEFLDIFLSKVNLIGATVCSVQQSKTDVKLGESDITIVVNKDNIKYGLLIEDKIDAKAQPNQYGRYVARGEDGKAIGEYDEFFVFIVAPKSYLESNDEAQKYPYKVEYEECLLHFQNKDDNRSKFKIQHIEQAIEKQKKGYQVQEVPAITEFWNQLYGYCCEKQIDMYPVNGPKGARSRWPQFKTPLKGTELYYKSDQGVVVLQFNGKSSESSRLKSSLAEWKTPKMHWNKTGNSESLYIKVDEIDFRESFEDALPKLPYVLDAVEELTALALKLNDIGFTI